MTSLVLEEPRAAANLHDFTAEASFVYFGLQERHSCMTGNVCSTWARRQRCDGQRQTHTVTTLSCGRSRRLLFHYGITEKSAKHLRMRTSNQNELPPRGLSHWWWGWNPCMEWLIQGTFYCVFMPSTFQGCRWQLAIKAATKLEETNFQTAL